MTIGNHVTEIDAVPNLSALEIDPEAAAAEYRARILDPIRGSVPEKALRGIEEQLSGACTTEIAAFDEFTALLTDDTLIGKYHHIIFDTAPTGHTIRLLKLPGAWSGFLEAGMGDASCLGPLAGLEKQRTRYRDAVDSLADGALTQLILVPRPRASALTEAARTSGELAGIGITNQHLAINGVMPDDTQGDALATALAARDAAAISGMDAHLAGLPQSRFVLRPENLVGLAALRRMASNDPVASPMSVRDSLPDLPPLARLVDEIARRGKGLVMTMGKGGVGKTTIAAAVAVELAARGHEVLLTTTDPAAHLSETLAAEVPNLTVGRIDPAVETARYRDNVLATKGADLDAAGRAMLEEDLRSPCTEEIAVFQAFSRVIRESSRHFVVMDTAPTGHTLLLLDATGSYHRDIVRHATEGVGMVTPMMRLQDPDRTRILIVTLPETTPVLEAARLQEDLRRAGIEPWAWVVNASLAATGTRHPLLAARAATELTEVAAVRDDLSERFAVVPMLAEEPVGPERLRALAGAEPELV